MTLGTLYSVGRLCPFTHRVQIAAAELGVEMAVAYDAEIPEAVRQANTGGEWPVFSPADGGTLLQDSRDIVDYLIDKAGAAGADLSRRPAGPRQTRHLLPQHAKGHSGRQAPDPDGVPREARSGAGRGRVPARRERRTLPRGSDVFAGRRPHRAVSLSPPLHGRDPRPRAPDLSRERRISTPGWIASSTGRRFRPSHPCGPPSVSSMQKRRLTENR